MRLVEADMIKLERNRGFRVVIPGPANMVDAFQLRLLLEVRAACRAALTVREAFLSKTWSQPGMTTEHGTMIRPGPGGPAWAQTTCRCQVGGMRACRRTWAFAALARRGGLQMQVRISGVWHRLRVRVTPFDHTVGQPVVGSVGRLGELEPAQPVQVTLHLLNCGVVE
jgi:hypothetical protein